MTKTCRVLTMVLSLCMVLVSCQKDPFLTFSGPNEMSFGIAGGSESVKFSCNRAWTISSPADFITVSPSSGDAAEGGVTVTVKCDPNSTYDKRKATVRISCEGLSESITVTQEPNVELSVLTDSFDVTCESQTINVFVMASIDYEVQVDASCKDWLSVMETKALTPQQRRVVVQANHGAARTGKVAFSGGGKRAEVTIHQGELYTSTDYSRDGEVKLIQKATEGAGVNIVLMGDVFSDKLIADGTYDKEMKTSLDALFDIEPYKSFRDLFNVYVVYVVSPHHYYDDSFTSALETRFPGSTLVQGNDDKVFEYAEKVPGYVAEEFPILVTINKKGRLGTANWMFPRTGPKNYPENAGYGAAIAYAALGNSDDERKQLVMHEFGGHAFAKLADEYIYSTTTDLTEETKANFENEVFKQGWNMNIDTTPDADKVSWSDFLADPRYANDGLGVYEGAWYYKKGIYKSSDDSMMCHNIFKFNAPSRKAIYCRIHHLAYGDKWKYDYEEFVKYDAVNRGTSPATKSPSFFLDNIPLPAPRYIKR